MKFAFQYAIFYIVFPFRTGCKGYTIFEMDLVQTLYMDSTY